MISLPPFPDTTSGPSPQQPADFGNETAIAKLLSENPFGSTRQETIITTELPFTADDYAGWIPAVRARNTETNTRMQRACHRNWFASLTNALSLLRFDLFRPVR